MDALALHPRDASHLAATAARMAAAGRELVSFCSREPALAGQASLEVLALEAKSILEGGSVERVVAAAKRSRPMVSWADLGAVERLEQISTLSEARLQGLDGALAEEETNAPLEKLGSMVGLAATTLGLIKTVF